MILDINEEIRKPYLPYLSLLGKHVLRIFTYKKKKFKKICMYYTYKYSLLHTYIRKKFFFACDY